MYGSAGQARFPFASPVFVVGVKHPADHSALALALARRYQPDAPGRALAAGVARAIGSGPQLVMGVCGTTASGGMSFGDAKGIVYL
jgi:hypothetical protein